MASSSTTLGAGGIQADFFMGCNAPGGFHSLYGELQIPVRGIRRWLIKGGPGTGKSSLMKQAAQAVQDREDLLERIHCSSDPDSLDGVLFHRGGASLVDATPPHVIEPGCPGAFESVINLLSCFNEDLLEQRLERITELQALNGEYHRKCRGLLKCADILLQDNARYVESCTDFEKIRTQALRFCRKELPPAGKPGRERNRLLTAVTNQGVVTYEKTPAALCKRLLLLRDEYGPASAALLKTVRAEALARGQLVYSCWSPLAPEVRLEHLLLPEAGLGLVTQSRYCPFRELTPWKVIDCARFTDGEALRRRRRYLRFNRRAAQELINGAVEDLRQAKAVHDRLEEQFTDAVDFGAVTALTSHLLTALAARYSKQ